MNEPAGEPQSGRHEAHATRPLHVVGVGASAGGLEALEALFSHMPERTGMAFVVLQHLSPDFESRMDQLLGRRTRIPIHKVQDGMVVEPDSIYLIPPRKEMIVSNGRLLLTDKDPHRGLSLPIDTFLRSLAQDCGSRAIALILSGTGSDGSRGIRDIHEVGGLVLAQTRDSARFDGMPRSAQATGVVDLLLPPESMPRALLRYVERCPDEEPLFSDQQVVDDQSDMGAILRLLRSECGLDFSLYKPTTVLRRVQRRMSLHGIDDRGDYLALLRDDPEAIATLYRDLLIGVTRFFRDGDLFQALEHRIAGELLDRADDDVRVWVAGCATGEEAYSIAMVLLEQIDARRAKPRLKVFATDVHRPSLHFASAGVYGAASVADVSDERRQRWFRPVENGFQVAPELRRTVMFAQHNVLVDSPFTRLDLASCRNLLIYLQPAAQRKVLSLLHFGLKSGGCLILGKSESAGDLADELEPVGGGQVFVKRRDVALPTDVRFVARGAGGGPLVSDNGGRARRADHHLLGLYDVLLDRWMPPALLLDESHTLLHAFGGAERYVQLRGGRPSANVLELITSDLKTALSAALQHSARENRSVRYAGLPVQIDGTEQNIDLIVDPVVRRQASRPCFLVRLEGARDDTVADSLAVAADPEKLSLEYTRNLEGELQHTRENLQATIEELETSNEELQATNEEMVAANEELQSTNEELHSVNEELYTVNAEHQRKIAELTELTSDMDNLLASIEVGVVFLDEQLRIRRITPAAARVFDLQPHDVGREFTTFMSRLPGIDLAQVMQAVMADESVWEQDLVALDGRPYLLRVLPYRAGERSRGVLLTLVDISVLRQAEADVRRLSALVASSQEAIVGKSLDGVITSWNAGAQRLYGWTAEEAVGQSVTLIVPPERQDELRDVLDRVRAGDFVTAFETVRQRKDGSPIEVSLGVSPVRDEAGKVAGLSTIAMDITRRRSAERHLRRALEQRDQFLAALSHELRNPLGAIQHACRLLDAEGVGAEHRERASAVMQRQIRHMSRLLEDLLDLSRLRRARIRFSRRAMDLRDTAQAVRETVLPMAEQAGVTLIEELDPDPLPVSGDAARLCQLQVNLLGNAIKYSEAGQSVRWMMRRENGEAVVLVQDHGRGIDPDELEDVFEPFVQSEHNAKTGMGLGLAIVRSIADAHGGTVTARSQGRGEGATFVLRLPICDEPLEPASEPAPGATTDGCRTVLLVEDQDDAREMLSELLRMRGYHVVAVGDGPDALEGLREHHPRVALIDLGLPSMSGHEVARRARDSFSRHDLFLVALTGHGQQEDREESVRSHFDRHLVKPVDVDVLTRVIEEGLTVTGSPDRR